MGSMVYVWNQTINKRQKATEIGPSKRSFLYLDLYIYILGHAWISKGSFMQTKHLCVLIQI